MRWIAWLGAAGFLLCGCGQSTSGDSVSGGGSSGGGTTAGSSGAGNDGWGTGNVGNFGGSGVAGGGAGVGNVGNHDGGGAAGAPPCRVSDLDCQSLDDSALARECIGGACRQVPPVGYCWADSDCSAGNKCKGGFVGSCGSSELDVLGKCTSGGNGCCKSDSDCTQSADTPRMCRLGLCVAVPSPGQCWSNADCGGGACEDDCTCICGGDCFCGPIHPGWCPGALPACCTTNEDCGPYAFCINTVCKKIDWPKGCWEDVHCAPGKKCIGANVCPCGATCPVPDAPGKCG
ncbi:MAG: hypothetical protein R3B13_34330 [Polyangiaceae bacterium]